MSRTLHKNEQPDEERRESPRSGVQIWATEKAEGYTRFHMISNLSLSGLRIEKKLPLPVGSMINLEVTLSGPKEVIRLKGVVLNTYKDSDSNVTGTGVKFVEMSEDVGKKLKTYIEKTINPNVT
jgi:hypothetical protein